jgi:uncharacterized RDD family membrane protein YckC
VTPEAAQLRIRLPEGVTLRLPLAGPLIRLIAFSLDTFVIAVLTGILGRIAQAIQSFSGNWAYIIYTIGYFLIGIGYAIVCEYFWKGQTLGKWLLGIRVLDQSGLELQFSQVALRNILRPIDTLPVWGLVGGIFILWTEHRQRLGDLAAGTVVIRERRAELRDVSALNRGKFNSFLKHKVLCARLRKLVPPDAGAVAVEALRRRDSLNDADRIRLFDKLSTYFLSLVEFPAEDVEPLGSEQIVRNAVEILYLRGEKAPKDKRPSA